MSGDVTFALVLPGVGALLLVSLVQQLRNHFTGITPRAWPAVLWTAAVLVALFAAGIAWNTAGAHVRQIDCELVAPAARALTDDDGKPTGDVEIVARVRWTVDGKTFTTFEPIRIGTGFALQKHDLEKLWRDERRHKTCWYRVSDPSVIRVTPPGEWTSARYLLALGLLAAAALLAFAGLRMWRRDDETRRDRTAGTRGRLGLAFVIVMMAGIPLFDVSRVIGWSVLGAGGAAFAVLLIREHFRSQSAFERVQKRMRSARHWPTTPREGDGDSDGIDPFADDRVTGLWNRCWAWVALTVDGAIVEVELERWPKSLTVCPVPLHARARSVTTGDVTFDRAVMLQPTGDEWRDLLRRDVRGLLLELVGKRGAAIAASSRKLSLIVRDAETEDLERILDDAARLARALPEASGDLRERVLAHMGDEPQPGVRLTQYRWLAEQGWNLPLVFRAAAADPDPQIASWGQDQLPPDGGAYR